MILNSKKPFKKHQILVAAFVLLLVLVVGWFDGPIRESDGLLHIFFFNVGEGDGIFIKTPSGETIVIDGGPNSTIVSQISRQIPFYQHEFDVGLVTHSHSDHYLGFLELADRYKFHKIYWNTEKDVTLLQSLFPQEYTRETSIYQGSVINLDEVKIEVLWPKKQVDCKDQNNCSLVLKLNYKDFCTYFMGDAGAKIQYQLSGSTCEVIKIAHQGAKDGTDVGFLKRVHPQLAVISVGENNYGHPAEEIITLLQKNKIKIWRTDEQGTLEIITDGTKWKIGE